MQLLIAKFKEDENAAVTVDWVVITAAIVGLCISVMVAVGAGTTDMSGDISGTISSQAITNRF